MVQIKIYLRELSVELLDLLCQLAVLVGGQAEPFLVLVAWSKAVREAREVAVSSIHVGIHYNSCVILLSVSSFLPRRRAVGCTYFRHQVYANRPESRN